jgi:hypothetical protein
VLSDATECDCGSAATRDGQCTRCEALDGPIVFRPANAFVVAMIIATLRSTVAASVAELKAELNVSEGAVQRALYRMMASGRVGRRLDDNVSPEREVRVATKTRRAYSRVQIDSTTRWMYYLTVPKEFV